MLAIVTTVLASTMPALRLRGGMGLGPITPGNFDGALKVAAAVTAASAISEKYADLGETTLTKAFKGDVWTTNLIISLVTGTASTVVYGVSGSGFEAAKLVSALWLASVVMKLKDKSFDVATLADDKVETVVALLSTYLAYA